MKSQSAIQAIARIDRRWDALIRLMKRRHSELRHLNVNKRAYPSFHQRYGISERDPASLWQHAWDSEPRLEREFKTLSRERGHFQIIRDRAETKEYEAQQRTERLATQRRHKAEQRQREINRCPSLRWLGLPQGSVNQP
jgi:hypothetical protein